MSWNNGYERKQFDEDQEKQAEEYRSMSSMKKLFILDGHGKNTSRISQQLKVMAKIPSMSNQLFSGFSTVLQQLTTHMAHIPVIGGCRN